MRYFFGFMAVVAALTSGSGTPNTDPIRMISAIETSYVWAPASADRSGFLQAANSGWQLAGFRSDGGLGDTYEASAAPADP
jgi:hypothetical protein